MRQVGVEMEGYGLLRQQVFQSYQDLEELYMHQNGGECVEEWEGKNVCAAVAHVIIGWWVFSDIDIPRMCPLVFLFRCLRGCWLRGASRERSGESVHGGDRQVC